MSTHIETPATTVTPRRSRPPDAGAAPRPEGSSPLAEQLRAAWAGAGARALLAGGLAAAAGVGWLFRSNVVHFVHTWRTDENYSHGFLVPLISLYFANEAARRGPVGVRGGRLVGLALLVASVLGRLATIVVPIGIAGDLAFLLGLAGIAAALAGRDVLRRYGFALFFLVFMVPLPVALYAKIAGPLQLLVSRLASAGLNGVGVPVLCQGNLMTLPGGLTMFVAEACSGMRQLTGFLALTTAVAFLGARPWAYRAALIGSAVPVAMTANVARVMVTGLIMYWVDPRYAGGAYHMIEGLLMMGFGLGLLGAECAVLSRTWPEGELEVEPLPVGTSGGSIGRREVVGRLALVGSVLVIGAAAQGAVDRAAETSRPPLDRPLASLPLRLGGWVGEDTPVDPAVLRESQADDYLNRTYHDPRRPGRKVTLWINYSRQGHNLRHSPTVCLPAGGWEAVEAQTRVLEVARDGGAPARLTRLVYRQGELVQGVGFWYYIFGEGRLERAVRGLPIASRGSHGRTTRGSGMTVEVFYPGGEDPDGEGLGDFAAALLDELEPMLPAGRANYFRP